METRITDLLFEVSQKLSEIAGVCKRNPVLDNLPELSGVSSLQDEVNELWRELMKQNHA